MSTLSSTDHDVIPPGQNAASCVTQDSIRGSFRLKLTAPEAYQPFHQPPAFACLTLFTSHECNLDCRYCYGRHPLHPPSSPRINLGAIKLAADFIARQCLQAGMPFTMGFHGDNEPLLDPPLLQRCLEIGRGAARGAGLPFQAFCTTNGVIDAQTVDWAAREFHGLTVSCDGPPPLHDACRRRKDGRPTGAVVERTIRFLAAANLPFLRIRSTITACNAGQQSEIVRYLAQLGVTRAEFFPVYLQPDQPDIPGLQPDPDLFVLEFLRARQLARQLGLELTCSATRWPEAHGRFCFPLQHNLAITTGGQISACFRCTGQPADDRFLRPVELLGKPDLFADFIAQTAPIPAQCSGCFNRQHCSLGCPDICPLHDDPSQPFDCRWRQALGRANLLEAAGIEIPLDSPGQLRHYLSQWPITVEEG